MGTSHSQYFGSSASSHNQSFTVDSSLDPVLWKRIEETATLARQAILSRKNLEDVQNILDSFSHVSEVINLRDMSGFCLLQHAIIMGQVDVARYLLHKGADVNVPTCARPLHLAAKLGGGTMLSLLLDFHADPDVLSCVCYPQHHYASEIVCVPQMDHMHLACNGDIYDGKASSKHRFESPRYYAIVADNVECVKILDKLGHSSHDGSTDLHLACKLGARECVAYFLQQNKDALNQVDVEGCSPLMHALPWSKPLVELLVLNGALLNVKTKTKQTLLHLLLNKFSSNMAETLKYLLDCGLRMSVNQLDSSGNSALHILLLSLEKHQYCIKRCKDISGNALAARSKFTRTMLSNSSPTLGHVETGCHEYFTDTETQYIKCVKLLLDAGLNPNIANRLGNTSLHIITRLHEQGVVTESGDTEMYIDMHFVYTIIMAILKARGNVNILNNSDHSIITQFVFYSLSDLATSASDPYLLAVVEHQVEYFVATVRALHRHGGELHHHMARSAHRVCYLHVLFDILDEFHSASHLLSAGCSDEQREQVRGWAGKLLRLILRVARCFLECGLEADACVDSSVTQRHLSLLYYKLVTARPLVSVRDIEEALRVLLHHGVDADRSGQHILMTVLRPHVSTGYRQLPCYPLLHLVNLLGTQTHDTQTHDTQTHDARRHEADLLALLDLLYNALGEGVARQCIRLYLDSDKYERGGGGVGGGGGGGHKHHHDFHAFLVRLVATPRKLKQLTAKFIYCHLAHRKMANVQRLPLPPLMHKYLASFHY